MLMKQGRIVFKIVERNSKLFELIHGRRINLNDILTCSRRHVVNLIIVFLNLCYMCHITSKEKAFGEFAILKTMVEIWSEGEAKILFQTKFNELRRSNFFASSGIVNRVIMVSSCKSTERGCGRNRLTR